MKLKKKTLIAWSVLAALLLFGMFWLRNRPHGSAAGTIGSESEVEGIDLTYLTFNQDNEKKLQVHCAESQKVDDDTLRMKKVMATIYRVDKLGEDIRISASSGRTDPDFNNFQLMGSAVISSPSFTLSSERFDLVGQNLLSTKVPTAFTLRDLDGMARGGMLYFINNRYVKLFDVSGTILRDGRSYRFKSKVLRVVEKKSMLFFDQDAVMEGEDSVIKGDRLSMQFTQNFELLEWVAANGNGDFRTSLVLENGRRQNRGITGDQIRLFNDSQGRLQKIAVDGQGEITMEDIRDRGRIRSDRIEIFLRSETQVLSSVRSLVRGTLTSSGRESIKVSGDSFLADYSAEGALIEVRAEKNCDFSTADFNGRSDNLRYDARQSRIFISGEKSAIDQGRSHFGSDQFLIQTQIRKLSTDKGVTATLIPEKKSALLGAKPVFVTADAMETSRQDDASRFTGRVNLFQEEVELQAGELLFRKAGGLSCRGGAELKFASDGQHLVVHGQAVDMDAGGGRIIIEKDAKLEQGANSLAAARMELVFGPADKLQDIFASGAASFSKKDIEGQGQVLHWQYAQNSVIFRDRAEIRRRGAGTTRGQELRLDLANNQIIVFGSRDRSETTIGDPQP